jgi:thiol:disulfide interchange protein DsbD
VGQVGYGLLLFFCLSLGLGLPLAVLAAFSGAIGRLPGAGDWMVWVRAFFGVVLVIMALYLARPLLPPGSFFWLLALVCLAGGVYLGFLHRAGQGRFRVVKVLVGLGVILVPAVVWWLGLPDLPPGKQEHKIPWRPFTFQAAREAASQGKPVVVLFTADWCPPCRKLKATTFPDPRVVEAMRAFVPLKVDLTSGTPRELRTLVAQWRVRGVPTVVFLDRQGRPMADLTMVGYRPPEAFLALLQRALAASGPAR